MVQLVANKIATFAITLVTSACLVTAGTGTATAQSAEAKAKITEGKELYDAYCVTCHGANMVNKGTRAYDLRKFPLNDLPRFLTSVNDGKKAMPAWKDVLEPEEVDMIWLYVKTRGRI